MQRLSQAILLTAESQRMLAAILGESSGMSLSATEAASHADAADELYRTALGSVTGRNSQQSAPQ